MSAVLSLTLLSFRCVLDLQCQVVHSLCVFSLLWTGGGLAAVCCQFLIQSRVIPLMKNRIIFMTMDRILLDDLKSKNTENNNDVRSQNAWVRIFHPRRAFGIFTLSTFYHPAKLWSKRRRQSAHLPFIGIPLRWFRNVNSSSGLLRTRALWSSSKHLRISPYTLRSLGNGLHRNIST